MVSIQWFLHIEQELIYPYETVKYLLIIVLYMVEIKYIPTHYCKAPKVFGWWTVAVIGSQELVIFREVSQPICLMRHKNEPYHLYLIASVHHLGAYNKNKQGVHIYQLPIILLYHLSMGNGE